MSKKTKFTKYKTFKNEANAKKHVEKLQKEFPDKNFSIKKRKFFGKLKVRFTVRSS